MRSAARPDGAVAASYIRRFAPRSPGGLSNSDSGPSQPDSPWHCAEEATVPTSRGSFSKGVTNWRRDSGVAGVGGGSSGGGGDCGGDCGGVGGGGGSGGGGSGGGGSGGGGSGSGGGGGGGGGSGLRNVIEADGWDHMRTLRPGLTVSVPYELE